MSWVSKPLGPTAATRRVPPSWKPWEPLPYQLRAVEHLITHQSAGLPLRPGGRKTSITLAAFLKLRETYPDATMLVVAPLRVCRMTWRQEAAKWEEFRHLKFSLLHGPKKDERLDDDSDIWLINPEGCDWLAAKYLGRSLPFFVVTIDELTKFKNSKSERSKSLRPRLAKVPYRWGLTGSLAPNGYMDLFGQMLMLDDGAALGRYITHYRDQYFSLGFDGFTYDLMPGAEKRIVDRIAPYWFQMNEEDYASLPPLVPVPHELILEPAERKVYDRMKRDMIASLPDGVITASNSAACYSKLSQMANGAVYSAAPGAALQVGGAQKVSHVHDLKLDALEDLLEELNGEPLLVAYEFNHDIERIRERFGVLDKATGKKVIPYLGKGTTAAQEKEWVEAWNRGELPLLCCHPASAGHGLNMQGASACNVCWFGITWDYELYDQFIRRIRRDGTLALQIFNHLLIVKNSIDELKLAALDGKEMTQSGLLRALNTEIRRSAEAQAGGDTPAAKRTEPVVMKLSRGGAPAEAPKAEVEKVAPKGWGKKPAEPETPAPAEGQQERIQAQLKGETAGESRSEGARSAFSGRVADKVAEIQAEHAPGTSNGVRMDPEQPADKPARATRTRNAPAAIGGESAAPARVGVDYEAVQSIVSGAIQIQQAAEASFKAEMLLVAKAQANANEMLARATLMASLVPLCENPDEAGDMFAALWDKIAG